MRLARALLLLPCVLLVMAGCAVRPPATTTGLDAPAARALLESLQQFTFEGRAAATRGSAGSQASLSWEQQGDESQLRLSGPLGMGATRVNVRREGLSITTSRGEQLDGDAALAALDEQTGFTLSFSALRFWVLGLAAPDSEARQTLDESGRLLALAQQGWNVTFDEYRLQSSPRGQVSVPRRLTAQREDLRLRLVIDRWNLQP